VSGIGAALRNGKRQATVTATSLEGADKTFIVDVRIDTPQEVEYYRYGGILPFVLRQVAKAATAV
jgi:aconitate hydratase